MQSIPLSKTKIETKLAIIREAVSELSALTSQTSKSDFVQDNVKFGFAEHHLRRALEAIFDISNHILSRFPYSPGERPNSYKGVALEMGKKHIISSDFAQGALFEMAGYRNRLVHFYDEVTREELYIIISQKLRDLDIFASAIIEIVQEPVKFGLTIEDL